MNSFSGVGIISDVKTSGKALKFKLSLQQEKSCDIPCLLFDQNDEVKDRLENLASSEQIVWLQGRVYCSVSEYQGKKRTQFNILTYANGIREILLF